jgi:hypothetical protein
MNANGPRLSIALSFHIRWESLCLSRMTIITQETKAHCAVCCFVATNTRKLLAFQLTALDSTFCYLHAAFETKTISGIRQV